MFTTPAHTEYLYPSRTEAPPRRINTLLTGYHRPQLRDRRRARTCHNQLSIHHRHRHPSFLVGNWSFVKPYDPSLVGPPLAKRRRVGAGEFNSCELKRSWKDAVIHPESCRLAKKPRLSSNKKRVLLRYDVTATKPAPRPLSSISAALLELQSQQATNQGTSSLPSPHAQVPRLSLSLHTIHEEDEKEANDDNDEIAAANRGVSQGTSLPVAADTRPSLMSLVLNMIHEDKEDDDFIVGNGAVDNDDDDDDDDDSNDDSNDDNDDHGSTDEDGSNDGGYISTLNGSGDDLTAQADTSDDGHDDTTIQTATTASDNVPPPPPPPPADVAATTTSNDDASGAGAPPPPNRDSSSATTTDDGVNHDMEPSPVSQTMGGEGGSMYISDSRYPTHATVRRSCRIAEWSLYREGMYKC